MTGCNRIIGGCANKKWLYVIRNRIEVKRLYRLYIKFKRSYHGIMSDIIVTYLVNIDI